MTALWRPQLCPQWLWEGSRAAVAGLAPLQCSSEFLLLTAHLAVPKKG